MLNGQNWMKKKGKTTRRMIKFILNDKYLEELSFQK